jgi:putative peptidoglycan lipid II flippase
MIFLLTTPFVAIISISSAYLQAEFKFIIPIASQLWPNVIVIISVMLLTKLSGVISIPLGILVGTIIQCINLIFLLRKKFKFNKNILNFGKLRLLSYPLAMTIIIEVSSQLFILADRIFYEKVEQGGIAALNYSMNLFLLPITIISIAFSTILFSKFSESISSENNSEFESSLLSSLNISSLIFIPIAIVFINFSNEIVSMIYQRGVFSSEDVQITSSVLQIFCIALLFYANYSILNKALYGMKSLRFLLFINVTGFVLKLVLNYFLVTDYKQNGLAFSTTFVFIFYFLTALIHILYNQRIAKKILIMKELCLSISNGVIIYFIAGVLLSPMLGSRGISKYSVILIFLAFYFLNALIVKQPSAQLLMEKGISLKHIFKAKAI